MLKDSEPSGKQSSGTGQDRITGDVAEALESAGVSGEIAKAVAETLKANGTRPTPERARWRCRRTPG